MYSFDCIYKDTRYWKCSSIRCKVRAKIENTEGGGSVESVSITGTQTHSSKPMKNKFVKQKLNSKTLNLSGVQCVFNSDDVCIVVQHEC